MRVLDLTHTIAENMPVYPGTETPIFAGANAYEKDGFKETKLTMYTHTGTHMDPPAHLFAGRTTLDAFPASQFIGKALVIECSDLNEGKAITLERILQYGKDAENADFLLFYLAGTSAGGRMPTLATIPVSTTRRSTTSSRATTRASASTSSASTPSQTKT